MDMRILLHIESLFDGRLERAIHGQVIKSVDIISWMHRSRNDNSKIDLEPVSFFTRLDLKHIFFRSRLKQICQQRSQVFGVANHILVVLICLNVHAEEDFVVFLGRFRFVALSASLWLSVLFVGVIVIVVAVLLLFVFLLGLTVRFIHRRLIITISAILFLLLLLFSLFPCLSFLSLHLLNLLPPVLPSLSLPLFILMLLIPLIL
mmetsp:Transcript_40961/g.65865  ORF Transcript_40961/g.65865 Transcript_40961/m.65865 type:complete len:205 (-) Transcript_40961:349-963(-)